MEFIIILLAIGISVFILLFVLPFLYFFITVFLTIRKIEKKVQNIGIEYNVFVIHRNVAITNNISFTKPFAITVETDNTIMTTSKLSQMEYLGSLKRLENEIDVLLRSVSANLKNIPTLTECITYFNTVKEGIAKANPYN